VSELKVEDLHGGYAEVGHGNNCVSLMVIYSDQQYKAGLVLSPEQADRLAEALQTQAEYARTSQD